MKWEKFQKNGKSNTTKNSFKAWNKKSENKCCLIFSVNETTKRKQKINRDEGDEQGKEKA